MCYDPPFLGPRGLILYSISTSAIQTTQRVMFHDTTPEAKTSYQGSTLPGREAKPWAGNEEPDVEIDGIIIPVVERCIEEPK